MISNQIFDLTLLDHQQQALFTETPDARLLILSQAMDKLKLRTRHGRDKVRLAEQGFSPTWQHRQEYLSPCYTTRWRDILKVG